MKKNHIKLLCRRAIKQKDEKLWTKAIDSLIDRSSEVDWAQLFSELTEEKQNYCIYMLIHKLATSSHGESFIDIIKQIGEAAIPIVVEIFYNHVKTIATREDFEKLQDWLDLLLKIIVYCNPPEIAELFIEIYQKSPNSDVRYMILENLGKLGGGQAIDFILKQLSDEIIYTRLAAIRALGLTKDEKVVPVIARELKDNEDNPLYARACLEALVSISDIKSIEILADYLHKELEYDLKKKIAKALLESPYIKMKDVESWFSSNISYDTLEILVKTIAKGKYRRRISEHVIKYVVDICIKFYSKSSDMYAWGVRLLKVGQQEALKYLTSLFLNEEYKDLKELDILISEFGRNAFPHLERIYLLIDSYEDRGRIIRLMGKLSDNYKLARFITENIDNICSILSIYIRQMNEGKILELFEIIGNALKDYNLTEALKPMARLLLSKCLEAEYSDEERFYIKILYHFYKYFYFKELEDYFIDYLQGKPPLWRYAFEALKFHETDRAKDILDQYEQDNLYDYKGDVILDKDIKVQKNDNML